MLDHIDPLPLECETRKSANLINEFFQSVSADIPKLDNARLMLRSDHIPGTYIISMLEVEKQLMNLDISNGPGPNGIPTWILHTFPGILALAVCSIFRATIREGHLPGLGSQQPHNLHCMLRRTSANFHYLHTI